VGGRLRAFFLPFCLSDCLVVVLQVDNLPYEPNIDVRDTVKYKEVMEQYGLGPNGAIVTSLNLFATKFDQVLQLIDARSREHEYMLFDTPGQIEVFTYSASGQIVTETVAATLPTVVVRMRMPPSLTYLHPPPIVQTLT
jgi:GTPase SAR1 family protein